MFHRIGSFYGHIYLDVLLIRIYKFENSNTNIKSIVSNTKILRIGFKNIRESQFSLEHFRNHHLYLFSLEQTFEVWFVWSHSIIAISQREWVCVHQSDQREMAHLFVFNCYYVQHRTSVCLFLFQFIAFLVRYALKRHGWKRFPHAGKKGISPSLGKAIQDMLFHALSSVAFKDKRE